MKEFKEWLRKGERDFSTAEYLVKGGRLEEAAFFLQQSAEKSLKAVYIKKYKEILKTHDLVRIALKIRAPKEIIDGCKKLTPAYQYTRYPEIMSDLEIEEEIQDFLKFTKRLIIWVKKII